MTAALIHLCDVAMCFGYAGILASAVIAVKAAL